MNFQITFISHYSANKYCSDCYRHSFQCILNLIFIFELMDLYIVLLI